jgi:hypothetical protein
MKSLSSMRENAVRAVGGKLFVGLELRFGADEFAEA